MDYPNFLGGSYASQSALEDNEQTINWYPERVEAAGGRNALALYPTPGQQTFTTTSDVGGRAALTINSRTHFVMGAGVYEVFATRMSTKRGTVAQDSNPAQITFNGVAGNQLAVASGGNLYYLDLTTNLVTLVAGVAAQQIGMIDGFFVAFDPILSRIRVSPLNDSTGVWDPTQFIQRSTQPDPWRAMIVVPPDIYAIGELSGDVLYDAGTSPFPLAPRPGITFRYGIAAPFSIALIGNSPLWHAQDNDGAGVVVQMRGYNPQPISSKALETTISNYQRTSTITDAEAVVYQQEGHAFYALTFPSVPATWVFDATLAAQGVPVALCWHQRGKWNPNLMRYDRWSPRVHTYAFGQHLVADASSGTIATLDVTFGTEADGSAIRRVRVPPPLRVDTRERRLFVSRFEPIFEPGLGTSTGQGQTPTAMLRISRDTKTWGPERQCSVGGIGQYTQRTYWLRGGSSTLVWQPELSVSDPIPWRLLGAELDATHVAQRSA